MLRVNIDEDVGRATARRYGVRMTPTFIVFAPDAPGSPESRERHRQSGFPDVERLEAEALNPL